MADKNIVAKDVGNGGYADPAKYGAKILKVGIERNMPKRQ
jgi:hypothetical protein